MKLLVFDVDGTLTATNRVDGHSFLSAVRAVLSINADLKWSEFTEVTASAILRELWATYSTEEYDVVEADVKRHFFSHLETAVASDPESFLPIRGAQDIFAKASPLTLLWKIGITIGLLLLIVLLVLALTALKKRRTSAIPKEEPTDDTSAPPEDPESPIDPAPSPDDDDEPTTTEGC